jgi:hypothetical protein
MSLDALRRTAHTPTRPQPPGLQIAPDLGSAPGAVGAPLTSFPSIVAVETVSMCNAACTFCPHPVSGKNEHQQSMTADLFTKIVTECAEEPDLRTFNLSFQNEPLMDPHVFARLRQARQTLREGVTISMVTNGSLLRGRRLQALLADPPDLLKISVTGIDADVYEADMRNLRFHVTLANIENLLTLARERGGPEVVINCVMTAAMETIGVRAIRDFWAQRGAQVHVMNLENRAGALPDEQLAGHEGRLNARSWCKRPEQQLSIWPDGAVALCCADWTRQVVLGTTQTQTLKEIWHHQTIGRFRDALRNGRGDTLSPCDNCTSAEVTFEGQTYVELGDLAEQL